MRTSVGMVLAMLIVYAGGASRLSADGAVLLTEKQEWRKHYMFAPPPFAGEETPRGPRRDIYAIFAEPPPVAWTRADFDDSGWPMRRGGEFEGVGVAPRVEQSIGKNAGEVYLRASNPFFAPVGLVCQRSRFVVADRKRMGKLTLSLVYRGGFVAYVNGREIARGHVGEGALAPDAPAEAYPPEAFFDRNSLAKGRAQPLQSNDFRSDQWALRERAFGPVEIPADVVRDGINVLALELHRGAYPIECKKSGTPCATVGLCTLELKSENAIAEKPIATPEVFAADLTRTLFDPALSRMNESAGPLCIAAARNGMFSAQAIVATSAAPLKSIVASVSPLQRVGGKETIPAGASRVRYAAVNPFWPKALDDLGLVQPWKWRRDAGAFGGTRFDVLLDAAPADVASVPVWITVKTPRDLPAGEYAGELTIRADGKTLAVPVALHLADWTLPDVKDYATLVNLYQSPESLASHYRVKPWSEEHWRLIDRSMQLLGEIGNVGVFIPLLAESQMGNPESMVVWTRKADGTYDYDFSVVDRYLDAALKHHDRLRFVALNVWGYEASLRTWRGPRDYDAFYGARVTVKDVATGAKESIKLPRYGTPECEALWKPVLTALRDRLKKRGIEEKILLGLAADQGPDQETAAMFDRILPGVGWIAESHRLNRGYPLGGGRQVPVLYNSIIGSEIPDPAGRRFYGWQHPSDRLAMSFNRSGGPLMLMGYPPPWSFRMWMESSLACGLNGNGRAGGDYWHIGAEILGEGERGWGVVGGCGGTMFGRYMHSHADEAGLGRSCTDLFGPGPDGPVSTVRLENAREGNQEAEARVFIERALLDKRTPLPRELADRCQRLLDERTHVLRLWRMQAAELAPQHWQERSRSLYDVAAEVAKTLGL